MAAPNHVPVQPGRSKYYESPPWRPGLWSADRPGDIAAGFPEGPGLGRPGPDQGYALKLVEQFENRVTLAEGERWDDAAAGCVLVGLKRASTYGRAPVRDDLEIAFRIWGFLDDDADPELVSVRHNAFAQVHNPHHYLSARALVDAVPDESLRSTPADVQRRHEADWAALVDTDALARNESARDLPHP